MTQPEKLPPLREVNGRKARRVARAPVRYSEEIADEIIERMIEGEALRQICRDAHMPTAGAVVHWTEHNSAFAQRYARAREALADRIADELLELADSVAGCADMGVVQAARLQIDTRKWIASKLMPRRYGEKVTLEGNPDAPLQTVTRIELVPVAPSLPVNLDSLPLANVGKDGKSE